MKKSEYKPAYVVCTSYYSLTVVHIHICDTSWEHACYLSELYYYWLSPKNNYIVKANHPANLDMSYESLVCLAMFNKY